MKVFLAVLTVLLFCASPLSTQTTEQAYPKCALEGQVVKAATGEPLPKAQILLQKMESSAPPLRALTDSNGQFAFRDVEPGRYRLSAERRGYVPQRYGQRGPQHPGTVLSLAPGQRLQEIVFRLTPHGVITGRVYDETGEPLPGVRVQVLRSLYVRGERQLIPSRASETNDLGEYRVYGLAPGRYYVSAAYEDPAAPTQTGQERSSNLGTVNEAYAATLYPGTNDPLLASPIAIRAGEEISRIDFPLLPVRTVRVRGQVLNTVANRPGDGIQVFLAPRALAFRALAFRRRAEVRNPDGEFEIRGVTPGSYDLVGVYVDGDRRYSTRLPLPVGHTDIDGVRLVITPGMELAGRIFLEDGRRGQAGTPELLEMSQLRILLDPVENALVVTRVAPGRVNADGTFHLENIPLERYRLNIEGLRGDYYLKAARLGGTDLLDQGLSLTGAAPPGSLELRLHPGGASIEGTVVDADGQPVTGAVVLLAPEPRSRHRTDLFKTTAADQHGRFTFRGITPLEYTLLAWEEVEPGVYQDPNFLRFYEKQGRVVRLQPADRMAVQLLAIPLEEAIW